MVTSPSAGPSRSARSASTRSRSSTARSPATGSWCRVPTPSAKQNEFGSQTRRPPMLTMKDVSKVYRTSMVETHALRDLTMKVEEGEFVAVTGPSGSGKTTFLNIAGLLEEHTGGAYQLDGVDVKN